MSITERIAAAETAFSEYQQKRDEHLKEAENCLTEMTKLQGEWRVLQELANDLESVEGPKVEVINEGKSKEKK